MRLVASLFDSEHYELNVGRVHVEPGDQQRDVEQLLEVARRSGYDVLFMRMEEADPLRPAVEQAGLLPLETLVTSMLDSRAPIPLRDTDVDLEHHDVLDRPSDIDAVCAIAADVLTGSHLHVDSRLPKERTRALFAAWTRNDVTGRAQHTFLARRRGTPVGFITVLLNGPTAVVDLVAVHRDLHGSGIGSRLLARTLEAIEPQSRAVTVGTQADNPALHLYARFGFVPMARHVTYHLWLDNTR